MRTPSGGDMGAPSEGELAAVLAALAGVRAGDDVVVAGVGRITRAALEAACGRPLLEPAAASPGTAAVAVVGDADALRAIRSCVRPGGRLVALASDAGAAARLATDVRLTLRHTEVVGQQVAWSGQVPIDPAAGCSAP